MMCYMVSIMKNDAKKGIKILRQKGLPADLRRALKDAREKRDWSQRDLASRLGIAQRHISGIESGKIVPRYDTLLEFIRMLDSDLLMVPRALVPTFPAHLSVPRLRERSSKPALIMMMRTTRTTMAMAAKSRCAFLSPAFS